MYWPGKVIYLYDYYCTITAFFKRSLDVLLNPTMFFILSLYQVWIWTGLISGESYLSLNTTIQRWILKWFKIYSHKAQVIITDRIIVKFIYTVSYFCVWYSALMRAKIFFGYYLWILLNKIHIMVWLGTILGIFYPMLLYVKLMLLTFHCLHHRPDPCEWGRDPFQLDEESNTAL